MSTRGTLDLDDATDAELLAAHVEGDPDAFAELVRRHRDRLWAVAVRTLHDREEAADALGQLAEEAGLSLIEMAIAFVLNHPAVTSAIMVVMMAAMTPVIVATVS